MKRIIFLRHLNICTLILTLPIVSLASNDTEKKRLCAFSLRGNVVSFSEGRRSTEYDSARKLAPNVGDLLSKVTEEADYKVVIERLRQIDAELMVAASRMEELSLEDQAEVVRKIEGYSLDVRDVLTVLNIAKKSEDPKYQAADDSFIDPSIYRITRGHRIEMFVEVPLDGVSRHHSAFFKKLVESTTKIVGLDTSNNDIRRLQLQPGSILMREIRGKKDKRGDNIVQITGIPGLLRLMKENPNHPGLIYGEYAKDNIRAAISSKYSYKLISGVVKEPPGGSNQGMLTLADGTQVEMANVRMLNVVGVELPSFLSRGPDEIYLWRPVRVWNQVGAKWVTGRVVTPDSAHGLVEVIADEQIGQNMDYHNGRGIAVGRKSIDLDLRHPKLYSEKKHPLQGYPHLQREAVVKFKTESGETDYGYVDQIAAGEGFYQVKDSKGMWPQLPLDEPVQFLDLRITPSEQPLVKRGNRISLHDFRARKVRVFEILAYDPVDKIIVTSIVSLRPIELTLVSTFRLDDSRLRFIGNDNSEVFRAHPELAKIRRFSGFKRKIEFYDEGGQKRTGEILSRETLPAFVEVIIERQPEERDASGDHYFRFDVDPSRIIRVWNPYEIK